MEHIIAAFIIACANLTQPTVNRQSAEEATKQKSACIQRVSKCVKDIKTNVLDCADKVY